ncbi:type 1 glutamine amidotransferase domain-containing protein [Edaphobacter sp. DSM 109919]|uniref:Type 1 glutamine amidotransferase domain-containing protein n=1 Tax=Edaphobacter paludis TaxID=3035702 RepID=A0AAU7CX89_9BACT
MVTARVAFAQTSTPRVLILVTSADRFPDGRQTGAWLEEFATPYNALVHAGAKVMVTSPKGGSSPIDPHSIGTLEQEAAWKDARQPLSSTVPLASIHPADYDAIFIPGGHGPLFDLATDPAVAVTIAAFARSGKPVASVCHGPAALVGVTSADGKPFVSGKRITAFSDSEEKAVGLSAAVPFSVQQKLIALGGKYSQGPDFKSYAVVDGTLITGQNPASSERVAELLLQMLRR